MKIPKTLKVGAITYEVRLVKMKSAGEILRGCNIIKINNNLSLEQKWEAVFHELVHALCWELKEKEVELFAQGFYAVLKDNDLLK